jgi:hypothetical protein
VDAAIRDIEIVLQLKPYFPTGQDLIHYNHVQLFLNMQKKYIKLTSEKGDSPGRMELTLPVAFEFKEGHK